MLKFQDFFLWIYGIKDLKKKVLEADASETGKLGSVRIWANVK